MAHTIINPEAFAKYIEHVVTNSRCSYMDALLEFCDKRQIEPEVVAPFIGDKIRRHLQREGVALHLLPKSTDTELPFDEA